MPPKKKDKDNEVQEQKKTNQIQADQEMFLLAFEKPTQIYRYLRTRNMISPIFLHRNLAYMRHRMSRTGKNRKNFKINSMLATKLNEQRKILNFDGNFLNLKFMSFTEEDIELFGKVKVEVFLVKRALKKRKDIADVVETALGTVEVAVNSVDPSIKIPALSIPATKFGGENFQQATYSILFRIETIPATNGILSCINGEEPPKKKVKAVKTYSTELTVSDRNGPCLLTAGEYDMIVQENFASIGYSPKKVPNWESIHNYGITDSEYVDDLGFSEMFSKDPSLKFRLEWKAEAEEDLVDYPRPIVILKMENKENLSEGFQSNILNNNNLVTPKVDANDERVRIIYQFVYNNNSRQQTEACSDFHCPWCSLNCQKLHCLVKHLKLCHARFVFNYFPVENGSARIDVAINENYDGSYIGSPHDSLGPNIFSRIPGPKRRSIVTNILVCRTRRNRGSMNDLMEIEENDFDSNRPYISGHNRLYYHTMSCLPIMPKELDIDSESENDLHWLQQKTMQMIDEFTDVNPGEKELMKMWNLHVMKHGYVGDVQIPLASTMFLENHGKIILSKNLYRNFIIHMSSLFDYGLISPEVFYENIDKLQNILRDDEESKEKMKERFDEQKTYWKTIGVHKHAEEQKRLEEKKAKEKEEIEKRKREFECETNTATTSKTASSSSHVVTSTANGRNDDEQNTAKSRISLHTKTKAAGTKRKRSLVEDLLLKRWREFKSRSSS